MLHPGTHGGPSRGRGAVVRGSKVVPKAGRSTWQGGARRQWPGQKDPPALRDTGVVPPQCPSAPWSPNTPPTPSFPLSFAAGDVVLIQPQNAASHVERFCQVLGLDAEQRFTLRPREPGEPWEPWPPSCLPALSSVPSSARSPAPCRCPLSRAAAPALLRAAPRVPAPGHCRRAAALLLRAAGLPGPQRAGARQAAGAQLGLRPGGAVPVLQPAPQDHPGGAAGDRAGRGRSHTWPHWPVLSRLFAGAV